jgi:hypothetical protein
VPSSSISRASTPAWSNAYAQQCRREHLAHVADGFEHALAAIALGVTVAELDRLVLARGGARGHRRAAERAALESAIHLERGVAARVEDLASAQGSDGHHGAAG